jgi:GH15 family glucan-1,4-alpha-glucosidase
VGYQPIESYGVIGDLHTVALVGNNGSIDFLCFPHFDSPSVFAALLDDSKGGRFSITPALSSERRRQLYLPGSNVLITRFLAEEGVAEIVDFMPVEEVGHIHNLMRRVKTVRGEVTFRVRCEPRFDYGRASHHVEKLDDREVVFASEGTDGTELRLRTRVALEVKNGGAYAEFTLRSGEFMDFVLENVETGSNAPAATSEHVSRCLDSTVGFWRSWIGRCTYQGRWREMVNRSALVLKMLFSDQYGSLVAAPTFGLPERIGGERNWDYRYAWIRDSAFTLYVLTGLGYLDEANTFMRWIEERCAGMPEDGSSPLQVMYGLNGRTALEEERLEHFEGYRGSAPVRVGNGAYNQLQLDIYGELMDAIYLFNMHGAPIAYDLWRDLTRLVDWVADNWRRGDEGIWEIRGGEKEFLYSRLMCWVAIDRAVRIAMNRSFPSDLERWIAARDTIYRDIYASFWSDERGAFVQRKGSTRLDASSLLMPMVRFISFREPRWLSHLAAVEEELVEDSLVHRYRLEDGNEDGLGGKEGTFSMCSFWYVENLARCGRVNEARFYFEKMLGYANHLGLYSEELSAMGQHLGNFPQAFTHLGLISAALAVDRALSQVGWQA